MFLELLKRDHDGIMSRLHSIFDGEASRADMEARLLQYYSECYRDNKCFLLWVEAKLQSSRDAKFRAQLIQCIHPGIVATYDCVHYRVFKVGRDAVTHAGEAVGARADGLD